MDNPNPIYYRDLVSPDNSITNLIAQLETLIAKYEDVRAKVQASAQDVAKGLKDVAGATDAQRKSIELASEETDKLLKEYQDSGRVLKELNAHYKDGTLALKEFGKIQKLVDEVNRSAEGSYNKLSAQYRLNKIRLNEMSQAQREGTAAGRKLEAETKAIYERMNELQKATGKAQLQVGQYERALGGLLGVNPRVVSALTDSREAMSMMGGVVKALAGPIGVAIGVIGGITAAFKLFRDSIHETQGTGDAFDRGVAEWAATWDVFKKSVSAVDFSGFITGAREAAAAGRDLKAVLDETFERTNSVRLLRASMSEENAILQEQMRDQRLSYAERLAAADKYLANMRPIYEQEQETARRNADAQLEYLFSVTNREKYASKEAREAAKERFREYIQNYAINEQNIKAAQEYLRALGDVKAAEGLLQKAETQQTKAYYDNQRKAAQARIDAATDETKALSEIVAQYNLTNDTQVSAYVAAEEKYLNAQAAAYNDQKRIVTLRNNLEAQQTKEAKAQAEARAKASAEASAQAVAAAQAQAKAEAEARAKAVADERAVLNARLQSIQLEIAATEEGTDRMLELRLEMIAKQREIEIFENRQKAEHLRQDEQKINAKYDALVLRATAKFNMEIAAREFAAYQDLQASEFNLLNRNERQKTIFRIQQEEERLREILEMNESAVEKMTKMEVAAVKAKIEELKKERKSLGYNNLYELLGINLDSKQQSALNTAISNTVNNLRSIVDSWLQIAEAANAAADAQVSASQKALEAEIAAREAGYANNVSMAQKDLALAKKNQQQALKEKERAQAAQLAIDSITQASSLITASANIWSSLSPIPIVGPALAVAALATMWASFAAAKVMAVQATKQEKYGGGTVELLEGGSHASGHDIDLGTKKDGTRRRAEGGEFFAVINRRNSRKYRDVIPDVINSLNNGTFADRYQRANASMAGYAVGMLAAGGADVSGLEKDVAAIREQGGRAQYVDGQGNTVIRYKNLTRKVYKN